MYQSFHKTHLLNGARPAESESRLYTPIWVTLLLTQIKNPRAGGGHDRK